MRALPLLLTASLALPGCFPTNARHRTIAKIAEGASLAAGVGMLYFANTSADCTPVPGMPFSECKREAGAVSAIGLGLIIAGLAGFVVTVSTTPDEKPVTGPITPAVVPAPTAAPVPAAPGAAPVQPPPASAPTPAMPAAPEAPPAPAPSPAPAPVP